MIETHTMEEISMFILGHGILFQEYERIRDTSKSEKTVKNAESSLSNLHLILSLLQDYESMDLFLEDITLSSETEDSEGDKINLMTVHASKGLEFEYVFLVRFNNEVFPTKRSIMQPELIEEERRLAYVAITRAKIFLSITYIDKGFNGPMVPSRFLRESGIIKLSKKVSMYNTF